MGPSPAFDPALRLLIDAPETAAPRPAPRHGPPAADPAPAASPAAPDRLRLLTASYVAALVCSAALFGARDLARLPPMPQARLGLAVAMVGFMVVAWLFPLPFAFQTKVYLDTGVVFASILLFDPGVALAAAALGTAIAHALRRRTPAESVFNAAQIALQAAIGGWILGLGGWSTDAVRVARPRDAAAVLAAGAAVYLVNTVLVAGVIAIQTAANPLRVWRDSTLDTTRVEILSHLSQVGIGLVAAITADAQPWSIVLLVLPAVTIYTSFSRHLQLRQVDADRLRGAEANLELAQQEIVRHAGFDHLTSLPNRRHLLETLDRIFADRPRRAGDVALLAVDVDRFKIANDSLGHETGDRLLAAIAQRLRSCAPGAGLVARLGGDEFAILLDHSYGHGSDSIRTARRILEAFTDPFSIDDQDVFLTVSVGVADLRSQHRAPLDLMRDADVALFLAKQRGKARFEVFDPGFGDFTPERIELETDLRRAIERAELSLFFQPIVALRTGRIEGFEALVRWHHPRRGFVPPTKFIPLAEETGLIHPLGHWVLSEACRQARQWQEKHRRADASISVNLSARQFQQPGLSAMVAQILNETGLDPRLLRLEITEGVIMEDADSTIATLRQLKALGVEIAIDDFGTGYSSLAYLRKFPVDLLKIDRSFIAGLGRNNEDTSITQAVIGLGHALSLTIVAEGIETIGQLLQLCSLDCELGQGTHFAAPLPAPEAEALLTSETLSLQPVLSLPLHLAPTVA
ncbi:MAG TPA: bifunctional diguanylate cyclase/phosphodiesterase [Thermomicrobiales bacterium]